MKRLLAVAASAALAIGGLALAAPTASADDRTCNGSIGSTYIDGNVIVPSGASCNLNGTTTCGTFSSNIDRCRTTIWATQVTYEGGRYVTKSNWYFNNLTYKAAPRSAWAGNPLAASGVYKGTAAWTSDGRQWRTECDTDTTGGNGCRSYITADLIERSGDSYRTVTKWVFNNMVRFS